MSIPTIPILKNFKSVLIGKEKIKTKKKIFSLNKISWVKKNIFKKNIRLLDFIFVQHIKSLNNIKNIKRNHLLHKIL